MIEIRKVRNGDERSLAFVKRKAGRQHQKYIVTGNYKGEHPPQGCLLQEHLAHTLNQVWSLALPLPLHL